MRGFLLSAAILGCFSLGAGAQDLNEKLDSVVVRVSRAGRDTPVSFTTVSRGELLSASPLNSLPMTLNLQPSVVATNEGGTGLGYSKLTVRGSKGSQINVTLNGITLNDSESQEVFWVNIPGLSSILGSVQLQRGLGTSANGAGAFGASINMSSNFITPGPYAMIESSAGAYGTITESIMSSSGLLPGGFYAKVASNRSSTDGYIRNAWAKVNSFYAVLGWIGEDDSLQATFLRGSQHSGITWDGISAAMMEKDRRHNSAGEYHDADGNVQYYDNESDNYVQSHVQASYIHRFPSRILWSTTLNYTKGDGYYEQYKADKKYGKYGLSPDGNYSKADFIIRKEMDNEYLVMNSTLSYKSGTLSLNGGVYLAQYTGNHFGNVIWYSTGRGNAQDLPFEWYRNKSIKQEATAFARAEWKASSHITAYGEVQGRHIKLSMGGLDDEFSDLAYRTDWGFFNPRIGLTGHWGGHKLYLSSAIGHREPGRSDLKEQIESVNTLHAAGQEASVSLKPERMLDTELGYEFSSDSFTASANLYSMEYRDMLLETGRLSDSGYAIKENVGRSWRRGIELSAAWNVFPWLNLHGNMTLSENRIKDYVYFVDTYDNATDWNPLPQTRVEAGTVDMLMSPSAIAALGLAVTPGRRWKLSMDGKYVGSQYWDNTQNADRRIPAYFVMNAAAEKQLKLASWNLTLGAYVNNLLNRKYYADAWVYRARFASGEPDYQEEGLFPQAPFNLMFRIKLEFR